MRLSVPEPADMRNATRALIPSTSRNWSVSAPATTRETQVRPPSSVLAKVPPAALAHTTFASTGLTAKKRLVVPDVCGVTVGARATRTSAVDAAGGAERCSGEQASAAATIPVARQRRFDGIVPSEECQPSSAADAAPRFSRGQVALRYPLVPVTSATELFLAELRKRGIRYTPLSDGRYAVELEEQSSIVSLDNLCKTFARDGDPLAVTRFVDAVIGGGLLDWKGSESLVYWTPESSAYDFGDAIHVEVTPRIHRVLVVTDGKEQRVTWLTKGSLARWGIDLDAASAAAYRNLDALLEAKEPEILVARGRKLGVVPIGSVFKASVIFA